MNAEKNEMDKNNNATSVYVAPPLKDTNNDFISLDNNGGSKSWCSAAAEAEALLAEERKVGTSHVIYLGGKIFGTRFLPTPCMRIYQLISNIFRPFTMAYIFYVLGFSIVNIIGIWVGIANFFLKAISIPNFQNDDKPVFMFIRGLDVKARNRIQRWWTPGNSFYQGIWLTLVFFVITLGIFLPILYIVQFDRLSSFNQIELPVILFEVLILSFYTLPIWITNYFCAISTELITSIRTYEIIPGENQLRERLNHHQSSLLLSSTNLKINKNMENATTKKFPTIINFSKAYENYERMLKTVEDFSNTFLFFFFCAEFSLALSALILSIGIYDEIISNREWKTLAICLVSTNEIALIMAMINLARLGSGITGAARSFTQRAHFIRGWIASNQPNDLKLQAAADKFYDHVNSNSHNIGFKGFGIIISPSLVAKFTYGALSVIAAVVGIMARQPAAIGGGK